MLVNHKCSKYFVTFTDLDVNFYLITIRKTDCEDPNQTEMSVCSWSWTLVLYGHIGRSYWLTRVYCCLNCRLTFSELDNTVMEILSCLYFSLQEPSAGPYGKYDY